MASQKRHAIVGANNKPAPESDSKAHASKSHKINGSAMPSLKKQDVFRAEIGVGSRPPYLKKS